MTLLKQVFTFGLLSLASSMALANGFMGTTVKELRDSLRNESEYILAFVVENEKLSIMYCHASAQENCYYITDPSQPFHLKAYEEFIKNSPSLTRVFAESAAYGGLGGAVVGAALGHILYAYGFKLAVTKLTATFAPQSVVASINGYTYLTAITSGGMAGGHVGFITYRASKIDQANQGARVSRMIDDMEKSHPLTEDGRLELAQLVLEATMEDILLLQRAYRSMVHSQ